MIFPCSAFPGKLDLSGSGRFRSALWRPSEAERSRASNSNILAKPSRLRWKRLFLVHQRGRAGSNDYFERPNGAGRARAADSTGAEAGSSGPSEHPEAGSSGLVERPNEAEIDVSSGHLLVNCKLNVPFPSLGTDSGFVDLPMPSVLEQCGFEMSQN